MYIYSKNSLPNAQKDEALRNKQWQDTTEHLQSKKNCNAETFLEKSSEKLMWVGREENLLTHFSQEKL